LLFAFLVDWHLAWSPFFTSIHVCIFFVAASFKEAVLSVMWLSVYILL